MKSISDMITLIILFTLLFNYLLALLAHELNVRNLKDTVPVTFRDVYDPDRYRRSQEYLRANTRFDRITSTFTLGIVLVMWFGKGFYFLDQWVHARHFGPVLSGVLYIGILALLKFILDLPFDIYQTFVIEQRFGFNRTTPKTFILDILKAGALTMLLGGALLSALLAFFEYAGTRAWWYCWIMTSGVALIMQYVVPTWIMPLFNRFAPLENGGLKDAIMNYARSIDFPLENIFVMDGSKRSSKSNAFFTGFGQHKRIVLFDTLIARHTTDELVAVLAHEMGHYKKHHILKGLVIGILHMGLLFFLMSVFISWPPLSEAFYIKEPSVYTGLVFFSMLYAAIDFFIGIFIQTMSRHNEYEADRFAVMTFRKPQAMISALKKLSAHNLSNLRPHPLHVFLNYSHPPVLQRIEAIEDIEMFEAV